MKEQSGDSLSTRNCLIFSLMPSAATLKEKTLLAMYKHDSDELHCGACSELHLLLSCHQDSVRQAVEKMSPLDRGTPGPGKVLRQSWLLSCISHIFTRLLASEPNLITVLMLNRGGVGLFRTNGMAPT